VESTYKRKLLLMHVAIAKYDGLLMLGLGDDGLLLFSILIAYGGATHLMVDVALTTHSDLGYTNWFWLMLWMDSEVCAFCRYKELRFVSQGSMIEVYFDVVSKSDASI